MCLLVVIVSGTVLKYSLKVLHFSIHQSDLPHLQCIQLGSYALQGDQTTTEYADQSVVLKSD